MVGDRRMLSPTPSTSYRRPHDPPHWPPTPEEEEEVDDMDQQRGRDTQAREISARIDRAIAQERVERRKSDPAVKLLLLGQPETGKSTTLKNFQLHFTPRAFQADAESWKTVIHLNLVRTVNLIFDVLCSNLPHYEREGIDLDSHLHYTGPSSRENGSQSRASQHQQQLPADLRNLQLRLAPLRNIEPTLSRILAAEPSGSQNSSPTLGPADDLPPIMGSTNDIAVRVRSHSGWKRLAKIQHDTSDPEGSRKMKRELEDCRQVICACGEDINTVWHHTGVRSLLQRVGVVLHNESGFYLNDVQRVTALNYVPTTEDIMRARLSTMGLEAHHLHMERGSHVGREWVIFDCGGSRTQRAVWAQFFDNVNAIIYLAALSDFNEFSGQDVTKTKLDESLLLWKTLSSNRTLAGVAIILFLNKLDLLRHKLKSGERFSDYYPDFDDEGMKKNHYKDVGTYIRKMFSKAHDEGVTQTRHIHIQLTTAIDTQMTAKVVSTVHDLIATENLKKISLA